MPHWSRVRGWTGAGVTHVPPGRAVVAPPRDEARLRAHCLRSPPAPRRVVLLAGGEHGPAERVLAELRGPWAARVHEQLRRLARLHWGRRCAAEWLGPRGWVRFAWCCVMMLEAEATVSRGPGPAVRDGRA